MEKNRPISVAFDDIRYKLDIINHLEYRFINDDLGMVISFIQMGSKLFHTGQPYRAKEGRIIRILQGTGRISINLIEYEVSAHQIIIIPDNSLIELLEISPDYDFQVIVPACNFLPALPGSILSETYTRNGIVLSLNEEEWIQAEMFFTLLWNILHSSPYRRETVQHFIISLLYNLKYTYEQTRTTTPLRLSRREEIFRRFIALVNEHSKQERSVNFYADKLCLTPHYLSTIIREASGQTVMQWINQSVVIEAKVLLKHSDLLIFQISDELNFPNPSFFSKFFKRMTGMTPAEYQKT
ncbi:helix-turn-helix domain-containing protein [Bacteroides clarus]|uniref:helix-turn-helix domain-containing protein n=1 Tax=Bacteroides clarus TaxID=626929 RepID=UPI001898D6AA|nr:helix-turn-helix domain-containing protein [Bacteroides clarus]